MLQAEGGMSGDQQAISKEGDDAERAMGRKMGQARTSFVL